MMYKFTRIVIVLLLLGYSSKTMSQEEKTILDLSKAEDSTVWTLQNRQLKVDGSEVHLDVNTDDGLLWLNEFEFGNGRIELDIRGKNDPGKSFVGIAFHGLNETTYDVIYFRAFNFKNPERSNHSVQYVSHPEYPWYKLRENFPEKYENTINPVPDPDDWFHATVIVAYPQVKVFVNDAKEPSLVVDQLSRRAGGRIGFWVGYGSGGSFRNLEITKL